MAKRKILLYWSEADAGMAARKMEEQLVRAEKSTRNNAYGIPHGKDKFPTLKFSKEGSNIIRFRRIQETFGTDFYYAYAKQEDFKRFFAEMGLVKKA